MVHCGLLSAVFHRPAGPGSTVSARTGLTPWMPDYRKIDRMNRCTPCSSEPCCCRSARAHPSPLGCRFKLARSVGTQKGELTNEFGNGLCRGTAAVFELVFRLHLLSEASFENSQRAAFAFNGILCHDFTLFLSMAMPPDFTNHDMFTSAYSYPLYHRFNVLVFSIIDLSKYTSTRSSVHP